MKQTEVLKIARILAETPELFGFMKTAVNLPERFVKQMIARMEAENGTITV